MSVGAVNKNTGDRIPTAGMPAIDDALDLTSVNPVQNAIITAALANKQDKTDNSLQTTDKTVVGAINEHEGDIGSLKSGLTNQGARLTDIENGTVTSAGTATEGNTIALPPAAKVVYIRANINGYYYTPMCLVRGNHINIPLCALEWIATIALNYNNNTRLWTFESETTIAGTKRNQWTTNVEVFYS